MKKALRLLIIEDVEDHALLLVRELGKADFEPDFVRVESPQELETTLDAGPWDAVISDYNLPGFNGLDALRIVQAKGLDLPFILVSGVIGEEMAVESLKAGAHNFILKANLARLGPTMERELRDAEMRRERRAAVASLRLAHAELEQRVAERTTELQAANTKLLDSRRAALNMMEDAVTARRQAEETSAELQREATERRQAEKELRQAKEEWELTFNSVPDLIAILNDRHQVVRMNKAMAERLGREPAECKGLTCHEAIHGSDLPPEFCPHTRTMNDGREYTVELHAEQLDADFLVSTTPLLDPQGRMTGTVHVARDITERKWAEEELRRAMEAAEASTRAKSRFLANMSHELRTPMTGVLGMLDLVLSGNLDAEQKKFIKIAQASANSLVRILNDILDLTKIEAGKLTIEEIPFSLRKCVEDTVSLLLPSALSKGLDLNYTAADDVPETVVGDRLRLNQILTNLAGNSVKFTDEGWVKIRVAAGSMTADGKREITITVADTGIGIPADKQHLLFRSFSQVDDSHSRIYGGAGLGLAISKEIAERMGGALTFTSEEGKGSTFTCIVPFAETEAARDDISASGKTAIEADTPRAAGTAKPRLLIAEDDSMIRQVLGLMLQRSNFEIDFAESGLEVVEIWEKGQYDLILMDVQMPGMNGFKATAAIREKERARGSHTPIIAMTAHALKEDEEKCFAAGMDSYISKPIDFKKSLQLIKDFIGNR